MTVAVTRFVTMTALLATVALSLVVGTWSGRSNAGRRLARASSMQRIGATGRKAGPPEPGPDGVGECLYVPCTRVRYDGSSTQTRRWVQGVAVVKKTTKWIYYTSDSWNRLESVVSPGCINREKFESCQQGFPAGVIPIPGQHSHSRSAGRLFFATREAAEEHLHHADRERVEQAAPKASLIRELRRAMADAHPDRGGTTEQFVQAHRRYQTALRHAPRQRASQADVG